MRSIAARITVLALALLALTPALASAVTYTVNSTADTVGSCPTISTCTLRQALNDSNTSAGVLDTIHFNISNAGTVQTITPTTNLPFISDAVVIDGRTETGYAGKPLVKIDGTTAPVGDGFRLNAGATGSTIEGLAIDNFNASTGIDVQGGVNSVTIRANFIGIDPAGATAAADQEGIFISGGSGHVVGGTTAGDGNVISGNAGAGLEISGATTVQGNLIGTSANGTAAVPNAARGVRISAGAAGSTIGGATPAARNVISGNTLEGIYISGPSNVAITGNEIGTSGTGLAAVPNTGDGIFTEGPNTTITGNVVSSNLSRGIELHGGSGTLAAGSTVAGNIVGLDANGNTPLGNHDIGIYNDGASDVTIGSPVTGTPAARNVVSSNENAGIDVEGASATNVVIANNFVGVDAVGTTGRGNGSTTTQPGVRLGAPGIKLGALIAGTGNVISANGGGGVSVAAPNALIQNNIIGLNASGTAAVGNSFPGVLVGGVDHTTIGGAAPGVRNVISGNGGDGVLIQTSNQNVVQGNRIGTNAAGTAGISNGFKGINIIDGSLNQIGGTAAGAGNLISGNGSPPPDPPVPGLNITIGSGSSAFNTVQGNSIGTNATGVGAIPNFGPGIEVQGGSAVHDNVIGGAVAGARNLVAFNTTGIVIGDSIGDFTLANRVQDNSIFGNSGGAIDLGNDGLTLNDHLDGDAGPNDIQNFPVIATATTTGSTTFITGSLDSIPSTTFRIDFYFSPSCAQKGRFPGGGVDVTTNAAGHTPFKVARGGLPAGESIAATATSAAPHNNTSELSACATAVPPVPPPQLHKSVDVRPVSGTVLIKQKGHVTPLKFGQAIPLGSTVDATKGRVQLTSAKNAKGGTQTAEFYEGQFKVGQTKGKKPVTMLTLQGPVDPCAKKAVTRRRHRRRHVWGSGHGSFGTTGRFGSATVRGTIWLTEDRCDGTYFKVQRGTVAVRDFRRRKTTLVHQGHSKLVKAH